MVRRRVGRGSAVVVSTQREGEEVDGSDQQSMECVRRRIDCRARWIGREEGGLSWVMGRSLVLQSRQSGRSPGCPGGLAEDIGSPQSAQARGKASVSLFREEADDFYIR